MKKKIGFIFCGLKVNLAAILVLALSLTACPGPDSGDDDPPPNAKTTMTVNNMSDYTLFSVEYAEVNFGDIRSGSKVEKEVPAGTQSLYFMGKGANGDQRIRLRDVVICEANKSAEFTINNNTSIVLVGETETPNTLKTIFDELFVTPFEGTWISTDNNDNINLLFISGNTIEWATNGSWDHKGEFTYTDSKIIFEFQAYYGGGGWEYYPNSWTEEWSYNQDKTQITWFGAIYKKIPAGTAVLVNKLSDLAKNPSSAAIELTQDELISPAMLDYGRDLTITIKSNGGKRYIHFDDFSTGESLFTIGSGTTLVLENNVIIVGKNGNGSLVTIEAGGKLIIKPGAKIRHHYAAVRGGGVYVGGVLDMEGGEISNNFAVFEGGGVYVAPGGIFNMTGAGAKIIENDTVYNFHGGQDKGGGGVLVDSGGTFTMTNGEISRNSVGGYQDLNRGNTGRGDGGGVYVAGTFTMKGGTIDSNHTQPSDRSGGGGGGVYVAPGGIFSMTGTGAVISNNLSQVYEDGQYLGDGGGVYVAGTGTFTMTNGVIKGNKASDYGGGVLAYGTFKKMSGGNAVIHGQTFDGTGVQTAESNSAAFGHGNAVYAGIKKRETTAGADVALDNSKEGAEGGWE